MVIWLTKLPINFVSGYLVYRWYKFLYGLVGCLGIGVYKFLFQNPPLVLTQKEDEGF